ncbi:MAG TPA: PQQ-binding-like beta-propeller repeat protein [Blastocatellia bacterium]|nr:PQQ-binding-like beta-propeller repeat protein [Blastocatellia bacterium]
MKIKFLLFFVVALLAIFPTFAQTKYKASGSDWLEGRGPNRDGTSAEKGLPEKWSITGENLVWKAPYGGRSAPIVMGNRLVLFNSAGAGETFQERVMAFDVDTGKAAWEYKYNVYSSDVPPRRVAWSSPAGDPETGNIYTLGAAAHLTALSYDGKLLWERSLTDEFGAWTTHGGRTASPIIEGNLVIVSTVTDGFGDLAARKHRYYAFDKRTGECVWISAPGGRPYDTTYSTPVVTTVNGQRVLIAGGGDGGVHAMKVNTGEVVWSYTMSKRGVNPGVVVKDGIAYVSHQEENLDTNEMGHLAAIDVASKGNVTKAQTKFHLSNFQLGPSSPVIDGNVYYQVDAGSNLFAFDTNTGKKLWEQNLGTIQKASPVFADGKIYVGSENGKFYIIKPNATGAQILDADELEPGAKLSEANEAGDDLIAANEQIIASVAVARGRIYLVSTKNVYCIGKKAKSKELPLVKYVNENAPANAAVAHVQVVPADLVLKPGEAAKFKVRSFDDHGRLIREETGATWSLEGLKGTAANNQFTPAADAGGQAGMVKATVGNVVGISRVRVIPALPLTENFETVAPTKVPSYWLNTDGKYAVREMDGGKVLVKNPTPPIFQRSRSLYGPASWANYTVEADVRATERRRQMGDGGVVAQRYELVMTGSAGNLEIRSWQIEPTRTVKVPFKWKADTWYRVKLEVQNLPDGKTRARGKAWLATEAEPANWMIERVDPNGNRMGSPGIFAYAPSEVFFDNIKVTPNK